MDAAGRAPSPGTRSDGDAPVTHMGTVPVTARQILDCYNSASVEAMARGRGLPVSRGASKEHILGQLVPILLDPVNIAENVAKLSTEELAVLQFVKESGGQTTTDATLQQMWARGIAEADADEAVRALIKRALLLYPYESARAAGTGRYGKLAGHHRFWAPAEVLDAVELTPIEFPADALVKDPPVDNVVPAGTEIVADLFLAWRYVSETVVAPLRGGGIGRRHRKRLGERLSSGGTGSERAGPGGEDRVDFLYHLLRGVGALEQVGERLVPTDEGDRLFDESNVAILREIALTWVGLTSWNEFRRIPEITILPGDLKGNAALPTSDTLSRGRRLLLEELCRVPIGEWVSAEKFTEFVRRRHLELIIPRQHEGVTEYRGLVEKTAEGEKRLRMPSDWDRVEGRFIRQTFLESLHWMGLVDLCLPRGAQGPKSTFTSFQITSLGASALPDLPVTEEDPPEVKLIVQPSFEMIGMNACENVAVLRRLERFAELEKVDKACSLRLTPESVQRGLKSGLSADAILAALERHSDSPLPQNVTYSLKDWAQAFEMIKVLPKATLLEVSDPAMLDGLADSPRWGRLILRRVGPSLAIADAARTDDLLALMERRGVTCRDLTYGRPPSHEFEVEGVEIRVPNSAKQPYTDYFLAKVADADEPGPHVTVHRLSAESVRRAMAQGVTLRELADFLKAGAREAVPTELLVTLKAWAGRYKPVGLESMVVFSTADAKTLDEFLKVPRLKALVDQRVGVSQALVPADDLDELLHLLGELGIEATGTAYAER